MLYSNKISTISHIISKQFKNETSRQDFSLKEEINFYFWRMQRFSVQDISPERFTTKVRRALRGGALGKVCTFEQNNNQICITFSQFGKSRIFYDVQEEENSFTAEKTKENIALTHGAFRDQVQSELEKLLVRFGAKIEK